MTNISVNSLTRQTGRLGRELISYREVERNKRLFKSVHYLRCWAYVTIISHFRVPKTLTFKLRSSAKPFLWKWVLFAWEWKIIFTSKAEHLTSFWYRNPRELGNGLLILCSTWAILPCSLRSLLLNNLCS